MHLNFWSLYNLDINLRSDKYFLKIFFSFRFYLYSWFLHSVVFYILKHDILFRKLSFMYNSWSVPIYFIGLGISGLWYTLNGFLYIMSRFNDLQRNTLVVAMSEELESAVCLWRTTTCIAHLWWMYLGKVKPGRLVSRVPMAFAMPAPFW